MIPSGRDHFRVAIIGSGFGGLGTAIRLKQAGQEDFVILEREGDVGGVWRDNSYPGCACDVQSHLYSFSFAPNPDWSRASRRSRRSGAYLRGLRGALRHAAAPPLPPRGATSAAWDDDSAALARSRRRGGRLTC